jgi:hypothetical protein
MSAIWTEGERGVGGRSGVADVVKHRRKNSTKFDPLSLHRHITRMGVLHMTC